MGDVVTIMCSIYSSNVETRTVLCLCESFLYIVLVNGCKYQPPTQGLRYDVSTLVPSDIILRNPFLNDKT